MVSPACAGENARQFQVLMFDRLEVVVSQIVVLQSGHVARGSKEGAWFGSLHS